MSADATSPLPSPPSGPDVRTTGLWGATTYPEAAWLSIGFTNYYWPDGDDDPTTVVEVPVTREACFRIAMQFLQMAQHAEWPDDDPGIYAPRRPAIDADRLGARVGRRHQRRGDRAPRSRPRLIRLRRFGTVTPAPSPGPYSHRRPARRWL